MKRLPLLTPQPDWLWRGVSAVPGLQRRRCVRPAAPKANRLRPVDFRASPMSVVEIAIGDGWSTTCRRSVDESSGVGRMIRECRKGIEAGFRRYEQA